MGILNKEVESKNPFEVCLEIIRITNTRIFSFDQNWRFQSEDI